MNTKNAQKPIVELANKILTQASAERASDIHIEPHRTGSSVKFRIDGELNHRIDLDLSQSELLTKRIKVIGKMNTEESSLPQDGRVAFRVAGRDLEMRIAVAPVLFGERILMRLLDKAKAIPSLDEYTMGTQMISTWKQLLGRSHGLLLVNGPTGSGKTSFLYSSIMHLQDETLSMMSVEDPVEYQLDGVGQIEVKDSHGLTFSAGMRAALRQDPDFLLVGDLQNDEMMKMSIEAATTGHLVLSTLHSANSEEALGQLLSCGADRHQTVASLLGIMNTRLVRRLCQSCKASYTTTKEVNQLLGITDKQHEFFTAGPGCQDCANTGYRGRLMVGELLSLTHEQRLQLVAPGIAPSGDTRPAGYQTWDSTKEQLLAGQIDVNALLNRG